MLFNVFMVSSMKLITLKNSTFFWWPPMLLEAISLFFECCVGIFDGAWLLLYSLLFELSLRYCTSCFNCLVWSFNHSPLFCFIDESDLDGHFLSALLMFIDLSICMTLCLFGWILVSLLSFYCNVTSFTFYYVRIERFLWLF